MNRPILLTCRNLIKPINQALERIEIIRQRKVDNSDSIILEGLFVLAVSSFEHSILDTLKVYFTSIPEKLDIKSENISKDDLINGDPLTQAIENKINAIGYKNISDILRYFINTTNINGAFLLDEDINKLIEIKATRNLLIHNNLIVNNLYNDTAGPNSRTPDFKNRLIIDKDYLFQSLISLRALLDEFKKELTLKYSSYTKIKATKNLFEYLFKTPLLKFEKVFITDEKSDVIHAVNSENLKKIKGLSSSESFFFDFWLAHFTSNEFKLKRGMIFHLDSEKRKQFEYFISVIDILKS